MTLTKALGQFVADLSPNRLPDEAAWIDGTAAHALDYDDVAPTNRRTIQGEPVARATGHPSRPLNDQQLYDKFADCLDAGGSPIPAEVLFERLSAIQSIGARDLTATV